MNFNVKCLCCDFGLFSTMAKLTNCLLLVVLLFLAIVEARNKTPLLDEDNARIRSRAAECIFGKEVKELGSQWIPDLGIPIGVLYCMKCECVAIQRKKRIVARVQCRNIKNECPEVTCDEPVLKKGQCCKMCPEDAQNPNIAQEQRLDIVSQSLNDEEEKNNRHFSALLTGRSSLVTKNEPMPNEINKNNIVATARFTFHKKNLHFSFYISEKAARPRQLQFVDSTGNILEEFTLSRPGGTVNSVYQNATRKVCGVWKRLPKDYRRLLKNGKMYAVLVWGVKEQSEFTISGQILKYVALASETFSSLLEPAPGTNREVMMGSGGTAIVSISTAASFSVHLAVIFNGLFASDETSKVPIKITLSLEEKKQIILEEIIHVDKPSSESNLLEISSPISTADLRLLTRGRLLLTISSTSNPEDMRLSGRVITKVACELFQATLSSSPADHDANPYAISGLAWLYLNNEGTLVYNIEIDNFKNSPSPTFITFVDVSTKRRTEIEDLTPNFKQGWANGTLDKLSPKLLEPLYSGNLAVNIATPKESSFIRGKLIAKPVDDARDSAAPLLLKRENYSLPTSASGLAWVSIDNDCYLHYDVSLSGLDKMSERKFDLALEMFPMLAPGAPVIAKHLDSFQGNQIEGSPLEALNNEETARLYSGECILKVKDFNTKNVLLTTKLKIFVPAQCRPLYTDNNVPLSPYGEQSIIASQPGTCFFEGKFYDEEKQWTSSLDECTMCFCQNGLAKCDTMACPDIKCPNGEKIKIDGECCPVCSDVVSKNRSNQRRCSLNGKTYSPGAKFHPFLMPSGFDTCTECVCDPNDFEIKCNRLNEKTCCKNCHNQGNIDEQNDDIPPKRIKMMENGDPKKVLEEGGCLNLRNPNQPHKNNSTYHPYIDSLGEYKCVTCKCLNGKPQCKREKCDIETCNRIRERKRKNEPIKETECCSLKECRRIRHKKNRHN